VTDRASGTEDESLALAARAGVHRIAVPTPFLVGRVNCYLIEDKPLTLIDTGPNSGKSLDVLAQGLAERGHRIEDLELIVITHQHMDHLGLLEIVARRSGAEVAALGLLAPYLESFRRSAAADDEFAQGVMHRHGVPAELVRALGLVGEAYRAFGSSGHVTRRLQDGDTLELKDRTLRAFHRPGHSPSDTIFLDEQRRMLFAGDHLLASISSNPIVSKPLPRSDAEDADADPGHVARPPALLNYMESMRATREMEAGLVLSGHGEPITDHVALIDQRLRMHQRRAEKMQRMLAGRPLSAYELALQMWGNVAVTQAFLTISEVLGHMDMLIRDGLVHELDDGELSRFEALSAEGRPTTP
jgi:glyoxylase-like metal-dependent hydrolase (beta-lactamase superfamily II)